MVLGPQQDSTAFYFFISLLIVGYALFFGYTYDFKYPVVGRVFYGIGEACMFFLVSLYLSQSKLISNSYLDLFLLGVIILLDLIYTIMELVHVFKNRNHNAEVVPEDSDDKRKKNTFDVEEVQNDSKDNLNESRASSSKILVGNASKGPGANRARRRW